MPKDANVQAAIAHWAPRFIGNGVQLSDFQEITGSIERWDEWCAGWSRRAAELESLGREALDRRLFVTAAEHLGRASIYYHFAKFVFVVDYAQMRAAHLKAVECRTLALPYMSPVGERVEIPFEGRKLVGILRKPSAAFKPPVVVIVPGLDSTKEELVSQEATFLDRGMATFSIDGPGQGEAEYDFPLRHNYETAVTALIDLLEQRPDVDASRIGAYGVSLGAHFVSRVAAFEKRIRAAIANGGPFEILPTWDMIPELTRETLRVRTHSGTPQQARERLADFSLAGVGQHIECPLFILNGTADRLVPIQDASRIADAAAGPVELLIIDGGNHCAMNRSHLWRPRTADWMAQQLRVPRD